ncbi:hypothetical protein CBF23_002585 [Marinomonas agarivorans]|nr:hypothetical protein CBF23_002585 [Marinomonas agarivorans]
MNKTIGLVIGSSLAFSSIIGAGILFIPSSLIHYTGEYANYFMLFGFLFAAFFSFMFYRISLLNPSAGLDHMVVSLLGKHAKNSIPTLLSSALIIGLPIAGVLCAKIISALFLDGAYESSVFVLIFVCSFLFNISSFGFLSKVQLLVVISILISIFVLYVDSMINVVEKEYYSSDSVSHYMYSGLLIAILAFAGLENMPAMATKFPKKNYTYFFSMIIGAAAALLIYFIFIAIIESNNGPDTEMLSWLINNDDEMRSNKMIAATFILLAVLGNIITWNIGMTALLTSVTGFTTLKIQYISTICFIGVSFLLLFNVLEMNFAVSQVGAVFSLIYVFLIFAYIKMESIIRLKVLAFIVSIFMLLILFYNAKFLIYSILVCALLVVVNITRGRNEKNLL